MRAQRVVEELTHAIYELTTVRPHEPPRARYTRAEFLVYQEGYYWALNVALEVMDATMRRLAIVERERRRLRREKGAIGMICVAIAVNGQMVTGCGHYINPDREIDREQGSTDCRCPCHPWNQARRVDAIAVGGGLNPNWPATPRGGVT